MGKNLLHTQITTSKQDKAIGMLVVIGVAVFVAFALQTATQSTIVFIDHTVQMAAPITTLGN